MNAQERPIIDITILRRGDEEVRRKLEELELDPAMGGFYRFDREWNKYRTLYMRRLASRDLLRYLTRRIRSLTLFSLAEIMELNIHYGCTLVSPAIGRDGFHDITESVRSSLE